MSCYVSLPAVIQVILVDPAYKGGKFGDIRELMMGESPVCHSLQFVREMNNYFGLKNI
jgi:hypothetical protein